jgi:hypothetical protein
MKTSLKNALRVSVYCTFISFVLLLVSCGKGSAPGPGPGDDPNTPNTVAAKISASVTAPSSGTIVLDGSGVGTKATIAVSATGNPSPSVTVDGNPFSGSQYITPDLVESKTIVFGATNSGGTDTKIMNVIVSVHPEFAKLCGNTMQGQSWSFDSIFKRPVGVTTWVGAISVTSPCDADDVYTFYPNRNMRTNWGTNTSCPGGIDNNSITYNVNTRILTPVASSGQPDRLVTFSGNIMTHTYTKGAWEYLERFIKIP